MDEFYEYWELIPEFEKYENVGKEIVKYKRNLPEPDISARDLPQEVIEFFQHHLLTQPYPTWEILYHIIDIRNQEKNRLLEELVLNALTTLIDQIVDHPDQVDKKDKLYNLLSNMYVSDWCMNKVWDIIVPRLFDLKENLGLLDDVLLLALLSRSVLTMLTQYMNYERLQTRDKCQMKSLFLRTCSEKAHWIGTLLDVKNEVAISSLNHKVYHHLKLFRLIIKMGSWSYADTSWCSDLESIDGKTLQPGSTLQLCFLELIRQQKILEYLDQNVESLDERFLIKSHLLQHLLNLQIAATTENFNSIETLLQMNHDLNDQQFKVFGSSSQYKGMEVQLFSEYMIVKLYLNLIQSTDISQDTIDRHLRLIHKLLQSIKGGERLHNVMQNVFTLIFLRFEHIRKTKRKRKSSEILSGSISNPNNSHTTDVSDGTADTLLNGFVCLKPSLLALLNSFRMFLMRLDQLEVYQSCDDEQQRKFSNLLRIVDNTLWRMEIVESEGERKTGTGQSVKEWLSLHGTNYGFKIHNAQIEITSDEERKVSKKKVNRKKLKKRPKLSMQTDENDEASDEPIEFQLATETSMTEHSESRTQSRSTESQRRVRSIISKMLVNPESLVAMCVLKNNSEGVTKVIEEYNLKGSEIDHEVNFITNFNETKKQLQQIVNTFKIINQRQATSMSGSIEIDEIKIVAEGGFEKAKFLNVLDKFTTNNILKARESDATLLSKAVNQYPNLKMYQGELLNVLPLIDFMISVQCPFELNHNVYKHIMKQWNFSDIEDGQFGYRKFLNNLMDILTIFQNQNIEKSISDLFNDDILSMDPVQLKKQLSNRLHTLEMLKLNVSQLNNEAELLDVLRKFDEFECEANFLAKIVCYVKNVRQLLKFQTNEAFGIDTVMRISLDDVIGKIIFNQQYSPDQVENFAYNININLVHSMAVAGGGEFKIPSCRDDEMLMSLFHLSEIGAVSVKPELNELQVREIHVISNMDILYYIKQESFMVAYLVKEIQNADYKTLKYDGINYIERMFQLPSIKILKDLFGGNEMVTALNYDHVEVRKILRKMLETNDLNEKLELLSSINERQWSRQKGQLNELRDSYIEMLITNHSKDSQEKFIKLEEISNVRKFCELLLKCIGDVKSDDKAERLLRWCMNADNISELAECQLTELKNWMKKLKIYRKIVKMFKTQNDNTDVSWAKIKDLADEKPAIIVNYLLNINANLVLCLEFLKIHPLKQRNDEITKMWVETLNNKDLNDQHHLLFKIIDTFPQKNVVEFFDFALGFINNLPSLIRVVNFLRLNLPNLPQRNYVRYQKFMISSKIFEKCEDHDLWSLASRPLIIIEQFLMNLKIETLRGVIVEVRGVLKDQESCSGCANTSSNMYQVGENLVYDFDAHHDGLFITNDCIDLLLKLYAAKALDFQIIEVNSVPPSTEVSSLDSLYGIFQMPKEIPAKDKWIGDDETSHCMCCKRQKFSLLTRRHHCRRCGRVICSPCSDHRAEIGGIYNNLMVRVCMECYQQIDVVKKRSEDRTIDKGRSADATTEWKLTGDISSDQMVRDEFNFEYSPNVGLCLAIIDLHPSNEELAKFLLFHCHRLELLLRPIRGKINPEVDLILVARMLKCLAFSAKIRGADGEANNIIDHADVVLKIAENGCESIAPQIPMEPINSVTIRAIINDLIKAENWKMALELSVKWDRAGTAGVFSAWAVSAIKSGQYRFAREKVDLALQKITGTSPHLNEEFLKMIKGSKAIDSKMFNIKRPTRSPPLLNEVLESLEATASKQQLFEPLSSPTSSRVLKRESSKNVLTVMDNLRKIVEGDYGPSIKRPLDKFEWQSSLLFNSPYYDESLFYLINYGGSVEFIAFLIRNNLVPVALRFVLVQQVSTELFLQHVLVPVVKIGKLEDFVKLIKEIDPTLMICKDYIMAACKYLERRRAFNSLYQMQMLTDDLVRASLTCVKFYLEGSLNYSELNGKSHHLVYAKNHLQTELEKAEVNKVLKSESGKKDSIALKWDLKAINTYINIISLQLEVAKYLAQCESEGLLTIGLMPKIFMDRPSLKTMFGKSPEKIQVAILLLVCGHSLESGFGISYRVIQECSLKASKIYTTCTKFLAKNLPRLMEVEKLVNSIKANAANEGNVVDPETVKMCDELVAMAVEIAYNQHHNAAKSQIDQLIRLITNKNMKIQCFINSNQLKTAYMLCASLNNFDDIRRIMKQAEITRQENVRRLCEKKLFQRSSDDQSQGSKSDINLL